MKRTLAVISLALVPVVAGAAGPRAGRQPLMVSNVAPPAVVGPLSIYLVEPCRFVDTRDGDTLWYETLGPLIAGVHLYLAQGSCGVPLGASGVILNVTVTEATASGNLGIWNGNTDGNGLPPNTSVINFDIGTTVANGTIVKLGVVPPTGQYSDLRVDAHLASTGTLHVILDVVGYLK